MLFGVGHVGRQMIRGSVGGAGPPGATLDLSFMNPGVLDPRITFTRAAGPATYFDSGGVMRTAATNLWLQSADASNVAWTCAGSLPPAAPVATGNQTTAPDGTLTAARIVYPAVSGGSNYSIVYQAITITAQPYVFSVWLKGSVGGEQINVGVIGAASGSIRATLTTQWQRFVVPTVSSAAGSAFFEIGCDFRDPSQSAIAAQTIFAWGGQVEQGSSASPYIPTTTAPNGAPRWDYDPVTLALKGLLIEEARTNSYRNGQFTGGTVGTPGTPPTNVTFFAPSGTVVASVAGLSTVNGMAVMDVRFAGNVTGGALRVYFDAGTTAAANAQAWTLAHSIAMVAGTLPAGYYGTLALDMTNAGSTYLGSLTSNQLDNPTVTLTRQSAVATLNQATTAFISTFYQASMNNGAVDFTLRFTMPQLELGAFPTSYIPTTAAAVTRAIDACSVPVGAWYDATKGSLSCEYIIEGVFPGFNAPAQLVGANVNTDYIDVDESTTTGSTPTLPTLAGSAVVIAGNGTTFTSYNNAPNPSGVMHRGASAWALNQDMHSAHDGRLALVGAAAGTPGPATSLPVIANLTIAGPMHYQPQFNLWARRVRYWPRMLSDVELQSVTT